MQTNSYRLGLLLGKIYEVVHEAMETQRPPHPRQITCPYYDQEMKTAVRYHSN